MLFLHVMLQYADSQYGLRMRLSGFKQFPKADVWDNTNMYVTMKFPPHQDGLLYKKLNELEGGLRWVAGSSMLPCPSCVSFTKEARVYV